MDVKTAFLNGFLDEEIYMEQPEGFASNETSSMVCKHKKSIYRLKQASRSWNLRFDEIIRLSGFLRILKNPVCIRKLVGAWWYF